MDSPRSAASEALCGRSGARQSSRSRTSICRTTRPASDTKGWRSILERLQEGPGISVFHKDDAGNLFHTNSSYGRGLDMLNVAYHYLDLVPKGRDEDSLPYPQAWVRHHDKYDD